ncbi:innexin unc-9-like [Watersipora subatra]|uniref:innexin unc-9-like n=1 Tax=Watersipora subatra TaxID=2589382 RepID=UPI00355B8C42
MSYFLSAVNSIRFDLGGDDDQADKMSCRYSIMLLVVFCVVVSTKQYVGDPIDCWVPGTFTSSMRDYTDNICWIKNTYYIPLDEIIPNKDEDIKTEINYYQWVPIMLIVQALFFYLPYMTWKGLNHRTGCDLKHIVKILTDSTIINQDVREKAVRFVTQHLDKFLSTREKPHPGILGRCADSICVGKKYGNYMITVYFIVKLFYLANAIGQLFLLNLFVGDQYSIYGFQVAKGLILGEDVGESTRFPRATLCSFKVREFGGNTHRHTVQCVLPINLFNEKIYLFFWFWLVFVMSFTVISIFVWMWDIVGHTRVQFIKKYIKMMPDFKYEKKTDRKYIRAFAESYLKQDGVFILRLIGKNVNEVILCEIVLALYEIFKKKRLANLSSMEKLNGQNEDFEDLENPKLV